MHSRTLITLLCACAALRADQVVLKNGDTITGTVVKKDGDKLTLKTDAMGEVSIAWSAVKSLTSNQQLVVVLPGGESVKGAVSTAGDNIQVAAPGASKTAPLAGVSAVRDEAQQRAWERQQHPRILQLWNGTYDMGLALTRGNSRTFSLTNSFIATRATTHDKITVSLNEVYATALLNGVDSATASAVRGAWTYDRNLNPKIFVGVLNSYEHDRFQSLDLRAVFGGGAGWNAVKTKQAALSFSAGGDYERENFTPNLNRNSAEVNFGDSLIYRFSPATSVTQSFGFFPNLSNTGQYRMNFDLSAVTMLKRWLGWHISASDRFLSDPVFGRQRNDLLLSTGFRLTFTPGQ